MATPALARDLLDPKQVRAEKIALDANPALPPTRVWAVRPDFTSIVYPNTKRFHVQRWQSVTSSYISPNCAAPGMPEPPSEDGPQPCGCDGTSGGAEAVYGHMESERLWPCRADWYDEEKPERAFAPDVWRGLGPCPATDFNSVLHQFPAYVNDARAGRPWFRIEETARREMENCEGLDTDVLPWLFPEDAKRKPQTVPRLVFEGAPSVEVLHARWAVWAVYVLKKRAFVSHEMVEANAARAALAGNAIGFDRMRRAYYFGYNAVGAWFDDTPEQVGIIRRFISLGIPVYYCWELKYADKQKLADLRPKQAPDEDRATPVASDPTPPLTLPPADPRDADLHWNSARRTPSDALDEYGYPLEEDEEVLELFDRQEAERSSSQPARSSPAPSSAPSQAASSASAGPPASVALSPRSSPAPAPAPPPSNTAATSWSHSTAARANRIPLHRRLSLIVPDVAWYHIPNVLEYFEQRGEYLLNADGGHLEGPAYFMAIDWRARLMPPFWLPKQFKSRMSSRQQNQLEQVEMAFRYGCAFQTVIPERTAPPTPSPIEGFPSKEAYLRTHSHLCVDELNLVEGNPISSFVENWATWISLFCERPHARAASEAGGLTARIARWGGVSLADVLKGPSDDVRNWGTPYPIEELVEKNVVRLMDDWLEPHELAALHGRVHCPSPKIVSLWPDADQFRRNWFNERGTWTVAMELWFVKRLEELWTGRKRPNLKTRAQWREDIREQKREEDAYLAKHG